MESETKTERIPEKFIGIDYAMNGMAVFSDGNSMDRDINAARNIKEEGKRISLRQGTA